VAVVTYRLPYGSGYGLGFLQPITCVGWVSFTSRVVSNPQVSIKY
jgi:hypothetical protein